MPEDLLRPRRCFRRPKVLVQREQPVGTHRLEHARLERDKRAARILQGVGTSVRGEAGHDTRYCNRGRLGCCQGCLVRTGHDTVTRG